MSGFADQLRRDLEEVFLDPAELAEVVEINGEPLPAIITRMEGEPDEQAGVHLQELQLVTLASRLPRPKPRQRLQMNGEAWYVRTVSQEAGLIRLVLWREGS